MGPQAQKEQGQRRKVRGTRGSFFGGGEKGERVKCVSCVKSGDLQGKAGLKLCLGCCASRS